MPRKRRKICFHYLKINDENVDVIETFNNLLMKIEELDKPDRKIEQGHNRFYLLDSRSITSGKNKITFKNAAYNFRPKLIDNVTIAERDSPKQLGEGERQKTHIITKPLNGEVLIVIEKSHFGVSINNFIKYLNHFINLLELEDNFRFYFETLAKDNFLDEIDKLQRITYADVIVDKQLLGSDALNFSDRTTEVNHEITVTLKAKRKNTIEDTVRDIFAKVSGGENHINRIRVKGRNAENNEVIINTDFIERQEYVLCDYDEETGEMSSADTFIELNAILDNFE